MSTTAWLELSRRSCADGNILVSLDGELDISTAEEAYAYLHETIDQPGETVLVDATGLRFCGVSGLGVFARAAGDARSAGRRLMMAAARPSLLRMLRITGLDRTYPELVPVPVPRSPL